MVVGLIVSSWLIAFASTLLASILFGVSWLGAIGLFFAVSTLSIFALAGLVVLHTTWSDFRNAPRPGLGADAGRRQVVPPTG